MDAGYDEKITSIVSAASAAPSGDNSQPWRFVFRAPNMLEFHAVPEKDNALLNVDASGTLVALGTAIQNAELEAKALGFIPEIRYSEEGTRIATFILHKNGGISEAERDLQQAIMQRHSNRRAYKKTVLADADRHALLDVAQGTGDVSFAFIEHDEPMTQVSRALTTMEEVALQNETLHKLFFESIFWSKERNISGRPGLYIRTLELPPPAQLIFKVLRYWPVARLLARIGFPRMVAETNAKQNATASAFGMITISHLNRMSYVEAGRLLERVWLAATARGMSLQIITGLLFLARAIDSAPLTLFTDAEKKKIREAYARVRKNVSSSQEPFLMFRVGYGEAPSAVSFRQAPNLTIVR